METARTIPEETLLEIVARLPLRSVARFKSICKTWKSVIELLYFRRHFVSLHRDSSSSWSLIFPSEYGRPMTEAIGFHGCEAWDLPKSLASYILPFQPYPDFHNLDYFYEGSSNGLILIKVSIDRGSSYGLKYFVGNPVLQQWVQIPPPPELCFTTGLVSRVEEDGLVSSFKVVMTCATISYDKYEWRVYVYSSETDTWTFKRLLSSHLIDNIYCCDSMSFNGVVYLLERGSYYFTHDVLIAHDFYSHEEVNDQCRVIPLPLMGDIDVTRCLTTSGGDVIYIELLYGRLKVWRLNDNNNSKSSECWQLSHEINIASIGFHVRCYPMGMNPFDSDIVYLWSQQHGCLVSGNLQRQEFIVHQESENWSSSEGCSRINTSDSLGYMKSMYNHTSRVLMLSQFVLPRWMDSVPLPPN